MALPRVSTPLDISQAHLNGGIDLKIQLLAAALAVALLAPGIATADHQASIAADRGLAYLRSQQRVNGGIADDAATAWAAIAFASAGVDPATVTRGGASLEAAVIADTRPDMSVNGLSRQVLAMVASGADPRTAAGFDAVEGIKATWDGTQLRDPAQPNIANDDIFGLQALLAAGVPLGDPVVQGVRGFILSQQQPTGAWSYGIISASNPDLLFAMAFADVDTTGQAIVALAGSGSAPDDVAMVRATLWLKANQGVDGGCNWSPADLPFDLAFDPARVAQSNSDSTSWGSMGVLALDQDPDGAFWTSAGGTLVDFLLAMQSPDGQFQYQPGAPGSSPASTTAWAVTALLGHSFLE